MKMNAPAHLRRAMLMAAVLLTAFVAACNVGVGLSASIPAPWGYVSVGADTSFPTHPGW